MRKNLYCIAIFLLISVIHIPAMYSVKYRHTIENATSFPAKVAVKYQTLLCADENFELAPQESQTIKAGACNLTGVYATLLTEPPIQARPYAEGFLGNGTWVIKSDPIHPNTFNVILAYSENLGQLLSGAAESTIKGISDASAWVGERFGDTKLTRGSDYAIRKAGLESAKAIAGTSLDASQAVALAPLIAAREIAAATLSRTQQFIDKVGKNVSRGVLKGSAQAAKGILEGVKKGAVLGIEVNKEILTKGPLDWIDINKIYYKGSLQEMSSGVLGNVQCEMEIFNKKIDVSTSLDFTKPFAVVNKQLAALADALGKKIEEEIFNPIRKAFSSANTQLAKAEKVLPIVIQEQQQIPSNIKTSLETIEQKAQEAKQSAEVEHQKFIATEAAMIKTLQETATKADLKIKEEMEQ